VSAGTVKTAMSARTMAVDPETGRLYLAAADIDPNAPAMAPPGDAPPGRPLQELPMDRRARAARRTAAPPAFRARLAQAAIPRSGSVRQAG